MQNSKCQLRKRRTRNHKIAEIAPNERLILQRQSLLGGVGGRERNRKEERERKNKAIFVRAEASCTRQDEDAAGSKQCKLLGARSPQV